MATIRKDYLNHVYLPRKYLMDLRKKKGLSQYNMAVLIKVETPTYNQIELGYQGALMNARKLIALSEALGVTVEMICRAEVAYLDEVDKANGIGKET